MTNLLYSMFYDMQRQAHWAHILPDHTAAAICSHGKPVWLWFKMPLTDESIRQFFYAYLQKYPGKPVGLVAEAGAAEICAKVVGLPYKQRELVAYFLEDIGDRPKCAGNLRAIEPRDALCVLDWLKLFYAEALEMPLPLEEIQTADNKKTATQQDSLFIWENNNTPCAMGMLHKPSGGIARLNSIYTPKGQRGKGYGKALVYALVEKAKENGVIPVLYTAVGNAPANGLYRSLGFKEAGRLMEIVFT